MTNHRNKKEQLEQYKNKDSNHPLTHDTGAKVSNDERTLKAGRRGPTLLQDSRFYRKQSQFSRERIPEKVVHARGFGLYGEFECFKDMSHVTKADFLSEEGKKTDVFNRFSNFVGSKGSKDTAVDVRGFATKFYTQDGNYDMLALQFPVFLVQDPMKFSDMVHAIKPNPKTETPQATSAHDNFWDYVVNNQETAHMVLWLMSMRGRPRSWRMMEGYPINTFRFVNDEGKATFVRFIWKPKLGVHSLLLEEANIIGGVDPDFHRNDMIEAVMSGHYPEYDLGVQLIKEEDEFNFDFDILDDTKLWPEEEVPVEIVGKMTLNRLVDNFFAEEEQSSFDPSTLVPGIEVSDSPIVQGRTFAYRDTDYHRLGTANLNNIPVNQPIVDVSDNSQDGYMRMKIDEDTVNYHKNSLADNSPYTVPFEDGGFAETEAPVEGVKTRESANESFDDYFSQTRMYWNSLSDIEKQDAIDTFSFHIGSVKDKEVRQKNIEMWAKVDKEMATKIAENIGAEPPQTEQVSYEKAFESLSMMNTIFKADTQKVGVLIGNDFEDDVLENIEYLKEHNVFVEVISSQLGTLKSKDGSEVEVDKTFAMVHPSLFDALYVVGGTANHQSAFDDYVSDFTHKAFDYYLPLFITNTGSKYYTDDKSAAGVLFSDNNSKEDYLASIEKQRFFNR